MEFDHCAAVSELLAYVYILQINSIELNAKRQEDNGTNVSQKVSDVVYRLVVCLANKNPQKELKSAFGHQHKNYNNK